MFGRLVVISILVFAGPNEVFSRKDAKTQSGLNNAFASLRLGVSNPYHDSSELPIDVFQVLDLPLTIHEATLVKSDQGFLLRLSLGNGSELKMIGLRYSLATIDSRNQLQLLVNRNEGFSLPPYATKTLTFKTPIRLKPRDGERFVLMLDQVMSRESIWEVVKARDALESYARGDYSVMPVVLRVANQVDAPPGRLRVIY
jgi:hypothetical protein